MGRRFECIIIGAGPAGLTAALILARAGVEVLVLERGEYPGSKNMFGGVLYSKGLNKILPGFWDEAPVERPVARWVLSFLDFDSCLSLDFKSTHFCESPYNAFTVLRARFDRWYARKVEEAGVTILTDAAVEDLLWDQGRVVGVKVGRDHGELLSDVVIATDGVNSLIARKSGLRKDLTPDDVSLGVKEILALPKESIDQAFSLKGGEGMAQTFIGTATNGVPGGGFIYTNKESLSVGLVTKLSSLAQSGLRPEELLEGFKHHPLIWPLVKDGELREYSAHLIPEGAHPSREPIYTDGLLIAGDAAKFTLSIGVRVEGANYAIMSGAAAAEAVKRAKKNKDFSRRGLSVYPELLKDHGVLADLKKFKHAPHFFTNPRLYQVYPEMACHLAEAVFSVDPEPKKGLFALAGETVKKNVSWPTIIKDAIAGWRSLA